MEIHIPDAVWNQIRQWFVFFFPSCFFLYWIHPTVSLFFPDQLRFLQLAEPEKEDLSRISIICSSSISPLTPHTSQNWVSASKPWPFWQRPFRRSQRFPRRSSWDGSPFERRRKIGFWRDRRPPELLLLPDFHLRHVLSPLPRHSLRSILLSSRLGKRTLSSSHILFWFMLGIFQHSANSSLWDFPGRRLNSRPASAC